MILNLLKATLSIKQLQEAEDAFHKHRATIEPSQQDLEDHLERAAYEASTFASIPLSSHYQVMKLYNGFEKD